jgi:pyrroline-5-carboxylate reductase
MPPPDYLSSLADSRIAFIGGGIMARSLIGGLIRGGVSPRRLAVAEPNDTLRETLARDSAVAVHAANESAARDADVWVLAVKPQVVKTVCTELRTTAQARRPLIISIAAGIRVGQLEAWLGGNIAIVRCMPNTPALVGAGATGACANAQCEPAQRAIAQGILNASGLMVWVDDEAQMDTVTAISGSGPAYFFLLVEAMEDAAVAHGVPRETARALAVQTCFGAGCMLREDAAAPSELRRRVTSPGGTTQAALDSFAASHFDAIVARAIAAATLRGSELSTQVND